MDYNSYQYRPLYPSKNLYLHGLDVDFGVPGELYAAGLYFDISKLVQSLVGGAKKSQGYLEGGANERPNVAFASCEL